MNRSALVACLGFVLASQPQLAQAPPYGIGRPATAQEIRSRDITVATDGRGLPEGRGTVAEGRVLYGARCASCHGDRGQGIDPYPQLVGGRGTLASPKPVQTVGSFWPYATTVWDYIRRAMPYQNPGTLSSQETYAVTAYLLYMNGIIGEGSVIDAKTLPRVRMPNRDGFIDDPRPDAPANKTKQNEHRS